MVATVIWTGHESESWQNGATAIGVTTAAANYDANFSRCAAVIGTTPVKWGPVSYGAAVEVWIRVRVAEYFNAGPNVNTALVEFRTAANQGILRLYCTGNPATFQLQYWSGSAWTAIGAAVARTAVTDNFLDIVCKINGTTGWFGWWISGNKQSELYNVNTNFFSATIDSTYFTAFNSSNGTALSEIIAANGETLGMRCMTLPVTGAGATNTFTSGTFADVDETTVNDADFLSSNTANQEAVFALGNLSAAAAALTPLAVQVNMRARNSAVAPTKIQADVRIPSTNYPSTTLQTPTTSFQNGFGYVWNLSPATGVAWTLAEMNAAEAGPKSIT